MRALLASPLGLLIGLSLGALGGGGSILAVPVLVFAAGQSPKHATATSLVLVALTSVAGMVPHLRAGNVRLQAGLVFGLAGIGGSLLGSTANHAVDPDVLLLAFSAVMLVAAAAMWRRAQRPAPALEPVIAGGPLTPDPAVAPVDRHPPRVDAGVAAKVAIAGTLVGLLTGFFGVGGGFVIVPALVLALGFDMPEAVGTSLLVITVNSVVALATRLSAGTIEWAVVVPFTAASMVGVVIGSTVSQRRDPSSLQGWFAALLAVVAVYTAGRAAAAIW